MRDENGKTSHPTVDHYTMVMQPDKKYCSFCKTNGKGDILFSIIHFFTTKLKFILDNNNSWMNPAVASLLTDIRLGCCSNLGSFAIIFTIFSYSFTVRLL